MGSSETDFDVIVVGGGFGGLATAIAAHDHGLRVAILEKSDWVGGAASYSGGQVWVPGNHIAARAGAVDSPEAGIEYLLSAGAEESSHFDPALAAEWMYHASATVAYLEGRAGMAWRVIPDYPDYYFPQARASRSWGRYLTSAPVLLAELGDDATRVRRTPHFPSGLTYQEMLDWGGMAKRASWPASVFTARREAGVVTFGEGLIAQLYRAVRESGIGVYFGSRASALLVESGAVIGVQAESTDGARELRGSVVLATSSYDWDTDLAASFSDHALDRWGSLAPTAVTGDGLHLARAAGAAIDKFPADAAPMLPGYRMAETTVDDPGFRTCFEHCLPHSMIVNAAGERFCDDSFYRAIVHGVLDERARNRRFFLIVDDEHRRRYGLGAVTPPGGEYPEGLVHSSSDLAELATAVGIDPAGLVATVASFNEHAALGEDPLFGRGTNEAVRRFRGDPSDPINPLVGPLDTAPFHALELTLVGTGIGASGIATTSYGRVIDESGAVIDGLYAIGACASPRASGGAYNSGFTLSRSMTFGLRAAASIANRKERS